MRVLKLQKLPINKIKHVLVWQRVASITLVLALIITNILIANANQQSVAKLSDTHQQAARELSAQPTDKATKSEAAPQPEAKSNPSTDNSADSQPVSKPGSAPTAHQPTTNQAAPTPAKKSSPAAQPQPKTNSPTTGCDWTKYSQYYSAYNAAIAQTIADYNQELAEIKQEYGYVPLEDEAEAKAVQQEAASQVYENYKAQLASIGCT